MLNDFITYLEQEVANHSIYVIGGRGSAEMAGYRKSGSEAARAKARRRRPLPWPFGRFR